MISAAQLQSENELKYTGFWPRVGASIIDTLIVAVITLPLLLQIYGRAYMESDALFLGTADLLISWVLPCIAIIAAGRRMSRALGTFTKGEPS